MNNSMPLLQMTPSEPEQLKEIKPLLPSGSPNGYAIVGACGGRAEAVAGEPMVCCEQTWKNVLTFLNQLKHHKSSFPEPDRKNFLIDNAHPACRWKIKKPDKLTGRSVPTVKDIKNTENYKRLLHSFAQNEISDVLCVSQHAVFACVGAMLAFPDLCDSLKRIWPFPTHVGNRGLANANIFPNDSELEACWPTSQMPPCNTNDQKLNYLAKTMIEIGPITRSNFHGHRSLIFSQLERALVQSFSAPAPNGALHTYLSTLKIS